MSKRSWSPSDIVSDTRSARAAASAPSAVRKTAAAKRSGTGAWSPNDIKPAKVAAKGDVPPAAEPLLAPAPAMPEAEAFPVPPPAASAAAPEAAMPTIAADPVPEKAPASRPARAGRRRVGEDPLDAHIGLRLRLVRTMRGMSQTDLAKAVGLTFQQVQKYEKGSNRISASMLYRLGQVLDVAVSFFYDDVSSEIGEPGSGDILDARASRGTLVTMRALQTVEDDGVRVAIDNLVRALAPKGGAVK